MSAIVFDGSFDGFMSVIYAVYYDKLSPEDIRPEANAQLTLGGQPISIATDMEKSAKVFAAIRNKISEDVAWKCYYAFLCDEEEGRLLSLVSYIRLGFVVGHMVDSHLHEDFVRHVQTCARLVGMESHKLLGFCRFAETTQGAYYCEVTPKNDVLPLLAQHFSKRMNHPWVIHDKVRHQAAIFDGKNYVLTHTPQDVSVEYAEGERETQEMWVKFLKALAIESRRNEKLQRQHIPLYFRGNMTEFNSIYD